MKKLSVALLCFIILLCLLFSSVESQENSKPTKPENPNSIKLIIDTTPPTTAGIHILKGKVISLNETFTIAFNLILQKEYFENKILYPIIISLHCRDQMGVDGIGNKGNGGLLGEGFGNLMVHNIGKETRDLSGDMPATKINPCNDIKFIGVLPQLPEGRNWETAPMSEVIVEIINWVEKKYRADGDRCYLTGYSYGGYGTWAVGMQNPERFAAIVPNSARLPLNYETAPEKLKNVGVWCSVGELDGEFLSSCTKMNELFLTSKHKNFKFFIVKNGGHHCYQCTFSNPDFWTWLLAQKRKQKN